MTDIDVVVASRNRHARLERTLCSLARLRDADLMHVIVIDDASDDAVQEAICVPPGLDVRIARLDSQGGPARARNAGVALGSATYIAFVDDDVDVDANWLAGHLDAVRESPGRTVSIGPLLAPKDWRPTPWNRWEASTLAVEYARMRRGDYRPTVRQFFTGNAVVPRALFESTGGFDERFMRAEDVELAIRLNKVCASFVFTPDAIGWHYSRRSLTSWRSIPKQYAFYDRRIADLHDPKWAVMIQNELDGRNVATKAFLGISKTPTLGAIASVGAVCFGVAASRGPAARVGRMLLSLAWQAEYVREWSGVAKNPDLAPLRAKFGQQ
jgi:GT2 family glycosyltransferase